MLILLSLNIIIIMDIILAMKRDDLLYRHNYAMCTWMCMHNLLCVHVLCTLV